MGYKLGKDSLWGGSQSDGRVLEGLCRLPALVQHLHLSCEWERAGERETAWKFLEPVTLVPFTLVHEWGTLVLVLANNWMTKVVRLAEKWEIAMHLTNNFGACCAYLAPAWMQPGATVTRARPGALWDTSNFSQQFLSSQEYITKGILRNPLISSWA